MLANGNKRIKATLNQDRQSKLNAIQAAMRLSKRGDTKSMNEKVKLIMKLTFNILLFLMGSSALCWYFFVIIYSGVFEDISMIKTYYDVNTLANVFLKCVFGGSLFMVIQHSTQKILDDVITQIRLLIKY